MLSSGLRKVMKALLILLAVAWITTDATATQLLRSRLLAFDPKRVIERKRIGYWANGQRISVKKNFAAEIDAVRTQQPGKDIQVWFMDEARIGQKGRNGHRWWPKGERAPGPRRQAIRFQPDGTVRRRSRCRWEEPSTAPKAGVSSSS